jgi:hypothetical protein
MMQARKREVVESLLNEGAGRSLDLNAEDLYFRGQPLKIKKGHLC